MLLQLYFTAEAGSIYILANYPIDEIVVIGSLEAIKDGDNMESMKIADYTITGSLSFGDLSECDFYCYRLQQFLDEIDIEGNDAY